MGRQGNENSMTKQARTQGAGDDDRITTRRHDDKQRDKKTTTTPPTPSPQTETDARRPHIVPRPKGQGMSEPVKASTATRRRHPHQAWQTITPTPHHSHDTRSGETGPDTKERTRAVFSSSSQENTRTNGHDTAAEKEQAAGQRGENEATGRGEKRQRTTSPKMPMRSHRMPFKGIY